MCAAFHDDASVEHNASEVVTVAVDAVGGDFAPCEVLDGVDRAISHDANLRVALVGPDHVVTPFAATRPAVTAFPASEIIEMGEHPAAAVRSKKDSSIVVGCRLVKEGVASGFISAGSTGAAMAAATLLMGRIRGVLRPAIATVLPAAGHPVVLLDVGANADCKPEFLVQFAHMGAAYSSVTLGVESPRVALLNIGEEPAKGSVLAQEAHQLMAASVPNFVGNVEGKQVLSGDADVIVTDGFTGNVALKLLEGTSKTLLGQIRDVMTASLPAKLAATVLRPGMMKLKNQLDPDLYGGAPLLGVDGVCVIAHGSSRATAVANAIHVTARAARGHLTARIAATISEASSSDASS